MANPMESSSFAAPPLGRRAVLRGALGGVVGGVGLAAGVGAGAARAADAPPTPTPTPAFDFDTGNAADQVIVAQTESIILTYVNGNDATIIVRITSLLQQVWFDAIAPYHPTAIGVASNLGRRPSSEGKTNRNKNIALLYASYHLLMNQLPQGAQGWRAFMTSVGLDPDDASTDRTSPIGLGNLAAAAVIAYRIHDGMNQLGEIGRVYNFQPFHDYTGYVAKNTTYQLSDPSHWQPRMVSTNKLGVWRVQQFITPQLGKVKPYTFTDVSKYLAPKPTNSDVHNRHGYKQQADEVLAYSAGLTDGQKMQAETFDDKFMALGVSVGMAAAKANLGFDEWIHLHMITAVAVFDALIACWYNKRIYDGVRPWTAISHLYGDRPVTAWGGPFKGTVSDLPANQWRSYLDTPDHTEYPSGSTTLFHAHAQSAARYLGSDVCDLEFTYPKGSSVMEPGLTPHEDITVTYTSWKAFADQAGMSRILGGVHFLSAINEGAALGTQFGDLAYEFIQAHVEGKAGPGI